MSRFDDSLTEGRVADLHRREEENLVRSLAPQYGVPYIDLTEVQIDVDALKLIPEKEARELQVAVFAKGNKDISLAVRNPRSEGLKVLKETFIKKGLTPLIFMVSFASLDIAWSRYQDLGKSIAKVRGVLELDTDFIASLAKESLSILDIAERIITLQKSKTPERVSRILDMIFGGALSLDASDIHIEPEGALARLRYRIDGVLWDLTDVEKEVYRLIISRLKLISGVKLNLRNIAQDGRFTITVGDREIEIRSSVIPGADGESMVMRLLDPDTSSFKLENLGLNTRLYEIILAQLARPNGALITTGPTGSGKTTALYAFLQHVHTTQNKIITLEDPVEYKLPGIVQTQVEKGYSFASGLRSILRQDPDVILVGEIRDHEVAETAVHAALTGHLVFSTLHTNSAVGAFPRLIDLGIDPRMFGSAFNIMLGQRLVRRLCTQCKSQRDATTEEQKMIARIMEQPVSLHTIFESKGCPECNMSGYKGRIAVFEGILVDEKVEEAILTDPREIVILEAAKPQQIPTMQQDGIMKVLAGITSLDELSRVLDLFSLPINE